jgi:hypothetical protein
LSYVGEADMNENDLTDLIEEDISGIYHQIGQVLAQVRFRCEYGTPDPSRRSNNGDKYSRFQG